MEDILERINRVCNRADDTLNEVLKRPKSKYIDRVEILDHRKISDNIENFNESQSRE